MTAATKMRFVPRNFLDEATVSATSGADWSTQFPLSNMALVARSSVWRSNTAAGVPTPSTIDIKWTWSRNRKVTFFGLFKHLCQGSKLQLQLYSDAAWVTSVYDSTVLDALKSSWINASGYSFGDNPYGLSEYDPFVLESPFWLWFTEKTIRSAKLTISTYNGSFGLNYGYWQIGRPWLGRAFQPIINPFYGLQIGVRDNSLRQRTLGGSRRSVRGNKWRWQKFNLGRVDPTELATWLNIMETCQVSADVVCSIYPEDDTILERNHLINGGLVSLDALGQEIGWLEKTLEIEEN